jgi:hypothetical protein
MKNAGIQINNDYELNIKLRHDETGKILSGFVIDAVTYQNQAMILLLHKGELKENPLFGVGLGDICNDNGFDLWERDIREQMEADGQRISKLILNQVGLILEAKYI